VGNQTFIDDVAVNPGWFPGFQRMDDDGTIFAAVLNRKVFSCSKPLHLGILVFPLLFPGFSREFAEIAEFVLTDEFGAFAEIGGIFGHMSAGLGNKIAESLKNFSADDVRSRPMGIHILKNRGVFKFLA